VTAGNKLKILAGTAGFLFLVKAAAGWFLGKYFVYFGLPAHKEPHENWDDFEECFYGPLFAAAGQRQQEG